MDKEMILSKASQTKEELETVRRYAKENEIIDTYKAKNGIRQKLIIPGGEYATLYLHPEYETKWKGTFYDKERVFLSTSLKDVHSLFKYHFFEELGMRKKQTFEFLGYCDSASGTEQGVRIHLIDPYGEVLLPPFFGMPSDMIMLYIGKMLIVKADFTPEGTFIKEVATLPFTLTERITEGHPLYDTLTE